MSQVEVQKGDWVRIGERTCPYIVINSTPDSDGDIRVARLRNQKGTSFANPSHITHVIPGGLKNGDDVYVDDESEPRLVKQATPDSDHECKVNGCYGSTEWSYFPWYRLTKVINSTSQSENTQNTKQQKETTMSNQAAAQAARQVVQVIIVDPDAGLKPEDALVADLGQHVLEGPVDNLKLKLAMSQEINLQSKLNAHNTKRAKLTDLDILNRTGQEVKMQPIEIEDLVWQIK